MVQPPHKFGDPDVSYKVSSVKTIASDAVMDNLLSEFPALIKSSGINREVRHNTMHYIRTTPGPPIA